MSVFQLGTTAEFKKRLLGLSREDLLGIIQDQNPKYIHQIQMIEDTFRFRLRHLTWSDGTPVEGKDLTNKELSDLIDPPFIFDKDIARKWGMNEDQQRQIHFAADPVLWARHMLDVNIRVYQTLVLRDSNINKVMRFGRRAGKTFTLAIFMLWYAYTHNDGRIIVMTPMKAQSGLIYDEIIKLAKKNKVVMDSITRNVTSPQYEINFSNGTTIRLFTTGMKSGSKSDVVRGQEGHVIILDEMDYMGEEDLVAVIPMLQKTEEDQEDKIVIAASTPTGQRQKFWEWNHDPTFTSFWYPSYCFCKETKITMADGSLKNIEEIQEGDLVQTESGGQKVTRTFVRDFTGDINHLRWYGNSDGVTVTDEHPFASAKSKRRQKDYKWDWTKTADLEIREKRNLNSGSLLRSPVFAKESEAPIDMLMLHDDLYESSPGRVKLKRPFKNGVGQNFKNDFPRFVYPDEVCWGSLVGWYLAEGNLDRLSDLYKCYLGIDFTLHIDETDYVDELCNLFEKFTLGTPILSKRPAQNSIKVSISNPPFAILLNHLCGIGSKTKKLSPFVMQASKSFQEALLLSYAKGDGYERSSGNFVIRTTSEHIAKQIQMIIAKISDYYPSISVSSSQKERNFNTGYKAYKIAPSWAIEYNTRIRSNLGKTKVSNSDYALLLKSKEKKSFQGKVYNFEVENTNSYIANGILVHNCNPNWDAITEQRIRAEQTEMQFRHEIEADWGEDASGVYPKRLVDTAFNHGTWEYVPDLIEPNSFCVFGVDWDKYGAGVNIVVLQYCTDKFHDYDLAGKIRVIYREEITKEEFLLHKAVDRIVELNTIFRPKHIYADQGYGEMQMEHIHMYGKENPNSGLHKIAKAWAFNETIEVPDPYSHIRVKKDLKPFMIDNLRYLLEQEKIYFPNADDDLYLQLISYIVIRTSMNNRPVFGPGGSAPDHAHDALLLAAFAIAYNYDDLLNPNYAVKARSISNETFLPMFKVESDKDEAIVEKVWENSSSAPVYTKRKMAYGTRRSSTKNIKRKMF